MKIRRLSQNVYSLIAAGEIIERPASIIRELIQNSIDACAENVIVEVENGGRDMLRVIDDGTGMDRDNLQLSIEAHATSKIFKADDINSVSTYGFRGEALHSVSSVSRLTIESRSEDDDAAHIMHVREGRVDDISQCGLDRGTIITVRDIFYNLPARRKFLKSINVELNHCIREFEYHALANPGIAFKFIHNGHNTITLPANTMKERVEHICGTNFAENAFSVDYYMNDIHISGFVGKPHIFTDAKTSIAFMFVNRRHIFNYLIRRALYTAFGTQLSHRNLPYVIFGEIPPQMIDVNIHPAKKEIKFRNESDIFKAYVNAVKSGIQVDTVKHEAYISDTSPMQQANEEPGQSALFEAYEMMPQSGVVRDFTNFYQFKNKYIITRLKNRLYIIDQHAAHERIMYEKFLNNKDNLSPQNLLFSLTVRLDAQLMETYEQTADVLGRSGFATRVFGRNVVLIEAVPSIIEGSFGNEEFTDLLNDFRNNENISAIDEALKLIACRSAIKAGQKLNEYEMAKIFSDLFSCSNPFACPHGRPTVKYFEEDEIERWFKRQ